MIIGTIIALSEVFLDLVDLSHSEALLVGLIMCLIIIELAILVDQRTLKLFQNGHVAVIFVTSPTPSHQLVGNVA